MNQTYIELEIAFTQNNYENIYNLLYVNGITSILEENGSLKICFREEDLKTAEKIKAELTESAGISPGNISISNFSNLDWNSEWEKTIEPVYIANRIVIYPSWKKEQLQKQKFSIAIEIDPKMSFGTGHNETTQLILEQMCSFLDKDDKYILDFGCGTGILAIAAVKLGAENKSDVKAIAIDIDDDSIDNAGEYSELNGTQNSVTFYKSDIKEINETGFDAVLANITGNIIIPNLEIIYEKLKSNGKLFITGILKEETEMMINALTENNFLMKELKQKAEWSAFYAVKK